MIKKQSLIVFVFLCASLLGFGQVSVTGLGAGNTYSQDFNTLANNGTSPTVPTGWSFSESDTNANTNYTAGTGSSSPGDTYSFGQDSNTERSLGGLLSGSLNPTIGVGFTNNTGGNITDIIISYKGETWRVGTASRSDRLDFQYSLDASSLTTGSWIDFNSLDYANPGQTTGSGSEQHSSIISSNITGLTIADGSTFWLRWNDLNVSGADDGMAIDDFSIYAMGSTDEVDWCNLQSPTSGSMTVAGTFDINCTSLGGYCY